MNFLKVLTQLNVVVNKYNVSFVNNHYGHVILGDLNIVKNKKLCQVSYKDPTYQKPKQIDVEEALEEMQTCFNQFIEGILEDKGIHKDYFSKWKGYVMLSIFEKKL